MKNSDLTNLTNLTDLTLSLISEVAEKRLFDDVMIDYQDGARELPYLFNETGENYLEKYQNIFNRHFDDAKKELEEFAIAFSLETHILNK